MDLPNPLKPTCPQCYPDKAYCPECGEKKFERNDLSFRNFLKDFFNEFTDLDSKLLRTLYLVTFKPGFLSEEYSRGAQVHYIKPLRLFLIIGVIHFLAFGLTKSADLYKIGGIISQIVQFDKVAEWTFIKPHLVAQYDMQQANQSIKDILSVMIYLVLFVVAGLYYLIFKRSRPFYSEHLVFFLHLLSAAFLRNFILIPIIIYNQYLGIALVAGINIVYVVKAINRYYKLSLTKSALLILPTMIFIGSMMFGFWLCSALIVLWK